ncbi:fructosamine kinase family protein [Austwickia chelonae]|uniref:fructosamine kinase family protein n=1 Tax=Austwickia chelonae TaxID=100225 RepID=UPI001F07DBFD|nr:fructosamine kinase family protein [Austwickia chelonae]
MGDVLVPEELLSGRHWLIDPACLWAHREVDLAMMRSFGASCGASAVAVLERYA